MQPDAILMQESNGRRVWWTLHVRGGSAFSASYESETAALLDAQLWCGRVGAIPSVAVYRLAEGVQA